jgi:hypothetical protein
LPGIAVEILNLYLLLNSKIVQRFPSLAEQVVATQFPKLKKSEALMVLDGLNTLENEAQEFHKQKGEDK